MEQEDENDSFLVQKAVHQARSQEPRASRLLFRKPAAGERPRRPTETQRNKPNTRSTRERDANDSEDDMLMVPSSSPKPKRPSTSSPARRQDRTAVSVEIPYNARAAPVASTSRLPDVIEEDIQAPSAWKRIGIRRVKQQPTRAPWQDNEATSRGAPEKATGSSSITTNLGRADQKASAAAAYPSPPSPSRPQQHERPDNQNDVLADVRPNIALHGVHSLSSKKQIPLENRVPEATPATNTPIARRKPLHNSEHRHDDAFIFQAVATKAKAVPSGEEDGHRSAAAQRFVGKSKLNGRTGKASLPQATALAEQAGPSRTQPVPVRHESQQIVPESSNAARRASPQSRPSRKRPKVEDLNIESLPGPTAAPARALAAAAAPATHSEAEPDPLVYFLMHTCQPGLQGHVLRSVGSIMDSLGVSTKGELSVLATMSREAGEFWFSQAREKGLSMLWESVLRDGLDRLRREIET